MKIQDFWVSRINWQKIENELEKYPSISKVFTLNTLKEASNKPPFYCHPLTRWFLYMNHTPIRVIDNIMCELHSLCGIEEKLEILSNPKNESWRF